MVDRKPLAPMRHGQGGGAPSSTSPADDATKPRRQHRLEVIGRLASGVAHEINNPVQSIMNYAQLIKRRSADTEAREHASEILHEAQRVASIVRNLLSFARQEPAPYADHDVRDLVDAAMSLIGAMLRREAIELRVDVAQDVPAVRCHAPQLQQALMSLINDAREALGERFPGPDDRKVIKLQVRRHADGEGPPRVRLTVEDCGTPLPEAALGALFDPLALGMSARGLGVSIASVIVREHGGTLAAELGPNGETRFHVDLPVTGGAGHAAA